MIVGTPMEPLPHVIWRPPNECVRTAYIGLITIQMPVDDQRRNEVDEDRNPNGTSPTCDLAASDGLQLCQEGLHRFNNYINAINEFSDPEKPMKRHIAWLYFEIDIFRQFWRPLAALARLWAATISRNDLRMAVMDLATKKKWKMTYHMFKFKNHLEAVLTVEAAFGLWRPPIQKMFHFGS